MTDLTRALLFLCLGKRSHLEIRLTFIAYCVPARVESGRVDYGFFFFLLEIAALEGSALGLGVGGPLDLERGVGWDKKAETQRAGAKAIHNECTIV